MKKKPFFSREGKAHLLLGLAVAAEIFMFVFGIAGMSCFYAAASALEGVTMLAVAGAAAVACKYCVKKHSDYLQALPPELPRYTPAEKPLHRQPLGRKFKAVCLTAEEMAEQKELQLARATVLQGEMKVGRPLKLKTHHMENPL